MELVGEGDELEKVEDGSGGGEEGVEGEGGEGADGEDEPACCKEGGSAPNWRRRVISHARLVQRGLR